PWAIMSSRRAALIRASSTRPYSTRFRRDYDRASNRLFANDKSGSTRPWGWSGSHNGFRRRPVCPRFIGVLILDRSCAHRRGGQRGERRWTGQTGVSSRVPSTGDRLAGDRPEGGGRGTRPGDQRAGNLWLAPAGADRPWAGTGAEDGGAGRARRGQTADP